MFRIAYGRDPMLAETKDMLLYGQLQEGLHLQLMRAPSVSGAKKYQELVVVAKNEERRLADLKRRQEYIRCTSQPSGPTTRHRNLSERQQNPRSRPQQFRSTPQFSQLPVASSQVDGKCYFCKKPGHCSTNALSARRMTRDAFHIMAHQQSRL